MLILTTLRAHNTSWPITPEFTQSIEGLHLLQNDLKSIQMKILFHSLFIKAIFNSWKAKSVKNSNLFFYD